jgi:hypothetical protein
VSDGDVRTYLRAASTPVKLWAAACIAAAWVVLLSVPDEPRNYDSLFFLLGATKLLVLGAVLTSGMRATELPRAG